MKISEASITVKMQLQNCFLEAEQLKDNLELAMQSNLNRESDFLIDAFEQALQDLNEIAAENDIPVPVNKDELWALVFNEDLPTMPEAASGAAEQYEDVAHSAIATHRLATAGHAAIDHLLMAGIALFFVLSVARLIWACSP